MHSRPTGTVTFLFTDIEGSTRQWEQRPEWMAAAFARQEAIIRAAVASHGGYAYKMIGDAFQAAFATAPQALAAALQAQAALHAEDWGEQGPLRVRMALHTGVTEERGDDYVGPALNRVARLLSLGHGGQILLTRATYDLVRDPGVALPSGLRLTDLGEHRLKDLLAPERIFQASALGLESVFPALRSVEVIPGNLPTPIKSFIGREREIAYLSQLLVPSATAASPLNRLVALTGAGGSGKTELALRLAARIRPAFPDGVWVVELGPLTEPDRVPLSILSLLGLRDDPKRLPLDTLADFLRTKRMLLVLDNCEHLVEACARTADVLLRGCPLVSLLATTREALNVPGETVFHVPPLATPDAADSPALPMEVLGGYEAVRLFVERAQTAFPGFDLTARNMSAVARICQRLDGLPLAIELAAARVKVLSAEQIALRLEDRFSLLTAGSRTAVPRHQTLRATIEWSHALLSEPEQVLFRRLATFAGGWTLEAAEAVCGKGGEATVLDTLAQLVGKSLVIVDRRHGAETRYTMLETIREYARERLWAAHEADALADRHLDYFAKQGRAAQPQLRGPEQVGWLERLEVELDNLRAALAEAVETEPSLGLAMAADLWWFWHIRGHALEGSEWLRRLLAAHESQEPRGEVSADRVRTRAQAQVVAGFLDVMRSDLESAAELLEAALAQFRQMGAAGRQGAATALAYLGPLATAKGDWPRAGELSRESLALYRELDDRFGMAEALDGLQQIAKATGHPYQAATLGEEALALRRSIGDLDGIATELYFLADVAIRQGQLDRAKTLLRESLAHYETVGNRLFMIRVRFVLGQVAWLQGELEQAASLYESALALSRITVDAIGVAYVLLRLGDMALSRGDDEQAVARYEEFVAQARQLGDSPALAWGLTRLGQAARVKGEYDLAAQQLEAALAFARETPLSQTPQSSALYGLGKLALARGDHAVARLRLAEALAIQRDNDNPMGVASSLLALAALAAAEGEAARAARLFGAADNLRHLVTHTLPPVDRAERDQALAAVRGQLGEAVFAALWSEGRALTLQQAIELALAD